MAKPLSKPQKPSWRLSRLLRGHWRLFISALLCVLVVFLLPVEYRLVSRMLVGWDAGVALYLLLVLTMIARSDTSHMRRHAALEDEGRIAIPILTVTTAMASLGAIVFWLRTASESEADQPSILALLFLTTLLSWVIHPRHFCPALRTRILCRASRRRWRLALSGMQAAKLLGLPLSRLQHRHFVGRLGRAGHLADHP